MQLFPAVLPEIIVLPCLLAPRVQHEAVTGWHPTHSGAGGGTHSLGQGHKHMEEG